MKMKIVQNGELRENCYLLELDNKYLVIDPGSEFDKIDSFINKDGEVLAVLITHRHFDHVGALDEFVDKYKCPVFDRSNLEEDKHSIGPFKFEVIYNPGHTPDSISFYFYEDNKMFVGDFIFEGNIGRCDLEGGDMNDMINSINKIKNYSDDITIYSGHGEFTKLGHEKRRNYYFNL